MFICNGQRGDGVNSMAYGAGLHVSLHPQSVLLVTVMMLAPQQVFILSLHGE